MIELLLSNTNNYKIMNADVRKNNTENDIISIKSDDFLIEIDSEKKRINLPIKLNIKSSNILLDKKES